MERIVIPRSRSKSPESMTRSATCSFERKTWLCRSMASTSVVFPWSTWAMIAIFLNFSFTLIFVRCPPKYVSPIAVQFYYSCPAMSNYFPFRKYVCFLHPAAIHSAFSPKRARAKSLAMNGRRSSTPSPTPIHFTGMESSDFRPMMTPPFAVPSSFVRTMPVIAAAF